MRSDLVKCGERVDDLQNGLFVIQDPELLCIFRTIVEHQF